MDVTYESDRPTAGLRHCWRDVRAWCAGEPEVPVTCEWEVSTSARATLSADDARRDAAQHVRDTGHQVNITVHDYYGPPTEADAEAAAIAHMRRWANGADTHPGEQDTTDQALAELAERMADQHGRLTGPPIPVDFTYDRNGLRLGIAALEDELRELYAEWAANKKSLNEPSAAERLRHEALDVAAVAMLIYRNIPVPGNTPGEG
jgi:hypothetical protein